MYKMKMPKMPKFPTWAWVLLVLAVVYYVFLREGVDATLKKVTMPPTPTPTVVAPKATA
jgi:hypothetical protein